MFISFLWGVFVRGVFGKGVFVQGVFVRGFMSGGFCPGGFCPDTSLSALFQEERLAFTGGGGGVHVKIQMRMPVHFFGFEIWPDPVFFLRGCQKLPVHF